MRDFDIRPLKDSDRGEHGVMLHSSFNAHYRKYGWTSDFFGCSTEDTALFFDVYHELSPGHSVAVFDRKSGAMAGACFFHPRKTHVSLGIMTVHPSWVGRGIGKMMVDHIIDFTDKNGYPSLRLIGSALNIDSFSLYNRNGFIPRLSFQDMVLEIPGDYTFSAEKIRPGKPGDEGGISRLEMDVAGVSREEDIRFALGKNPWFEVLVHENEGGDIDGFLMTVDHPASRIAGPGTARSEEVMLQLLKKGFERFRGKHVLVVAPVEKRLIVEELYRMKAINTETHFIQVRGEFKPLNGVLIPSFLPETA